jgi:hypothetical protein
MARASVRGWLLGAGALLASCDLGTEHFVFQRPPPPTGDDRHGPAITLMFVAPLKTDVGASIVLNATASSEHGAPRFRWSAQGGTIDQPASGDTSYLCKIPGDHPLTLTVFDSRGRQDSMAVTITCI